MWNNLTDDIRQRVKAAGPAPNITVLGDLAADPEHEALFLRYFTDNCDDAGAQALWDAYSWLATKNLTSRGGFGGSVDALVDQFWTTWGPQGVTPAYWPAEVTDWFAYRDQHEQATTAAYLPAWDTIDDPEDYQSTPEYATYAAAVEAKYEWAKENPPPLEAARSYAHAQLRGWHKAYADEVSRMQGLAMVWADLDMDYIVRLNSYNLDQLQPGAWHDCVGYGPYVLIGDFPPGYVEAVTSYDQSWRGTVTMIARGKALDPGKVSVSGCPDSDRAFFKETFRKSSKKAIVHQ